MYLVKVELDKSHPITRRVIADCQQMHKLVTSLFGTDRQSSGILYRTQTVRDHLMIYIYSQTPALHTSKYRIQQREISDWVNTIQSGQMLRFDLVASPCKKISTEGCKNSRRKILREPSERQAWLEKKADGAGFRILYAEELDRVNVTGVHSEEKGSVMNHSGYRYTGTLQITDADSFRQALALGFGPGKAYGFGMLLIR